MGYSVVGQRQESHSIASRREVHNSGFRKDGTVNCSLNQSDLDQGVLERNAKGSGGMESVSDDLDGQKVNLRS